MITALLNDLAFVAQRDHPRQRSSKMREPDRGVHEDEHRSFLGWGWALARGKIEVGHGAAEGAKPALGGMAGELFIEQAGQFGEGGGSFGLTGEAGTVRCGHGIGFHSDALPGDGRLCGALG